MICYYYDTPYLWIFASDLPVLLYYSHITVFVATLLVGLIVLFFNRKKLLNRILFSLTLVFAGWLFINLIAWGSNNSALTMTVWPFFGIFQALIAALSTYLVYVFIFEKDAAFIWKIIWAILVLPVVIFAPTNLTISGFDLAWCDGFAYENIWMTNYYTGLGGLAMAWILGMAIYGYKRTLRHQQVLLLTIGIELFLSIFFFLVYLGTLLASIRYFDDSSLEFYGIFGMGFFIVILGFLSVKYKSFNVIMIAPQALALALIVLVASQYTYVTSLTGVILTSVTLVLTGIASLMIIRNVKKEIKQREEIETLASKLEKANAKLKVLDKLKSEFVSIASHQLRSPLTSIRGYASMLLEGSYGNLSQKAKDAVERIGESSRMMALSVEDYLNVSRIQAGNMKYEYSDFNLVDVASGIVDDIRQEAVRKGLVLSFKSDMNGQGIVHADKGKTMQIIHNLVNNALKYTPKGTITVFAHDEKKKIHIDIVDTGIGMSPETIETIFGKFERAKNANDVNVSGTGLGLYVAQRMTQEMGGDIEAFSDGEGKGSTFRLTLPMQM